MYNLASSCYLSYSVGCKKFTIYYFENLGHCSAIQNSAASIAMGVVTEPYSLLSLSCICTHFKVAILLLPWLYHRPKKFIISCTRSCECIKARTQNNYIYTQLHSKSSRKVTSLVAGKQQFSHFFFSMKYNFDIIYFILLCIIIILSSKRKEYGPHENMKVT